MGHVSTIRLSGETFDHEYKTRVRPEHIDTFGHVNNAVYLQILEEARWNWIFNAGGDRELVKKLGVGPIVVNIDIRFSRELVEGDNIVIRSEHEGDIASTYTLHQWIVKENGELACRAKYRMAFLDMKMRKIVAPPPEWIDILAHSLPKLEAHV